MTLQNYVIEMPVAWVVTSEEKINILDKHSDIIGHVNRYYLNGTQKIVTYLLGRKSWFTNIKVEDSFGNTRVNIRFYKISFTKTIYKVDFYFNNKDYTFILNAIPKFGKYYFEFDLDGEKLTVINPLSTISPVFYDAKKTVLAKCNNNLLKKNVFVDVFDDSKIDVYFIAAISFMIGIV